jgi:hypothetical protein
MLDDGEALEIVHSSVFRPIKSGNEIEYRETDEKSSIFLSVSFVSFSEDIFKDNGKKGSTTNFRVGELTFVI